MAALPTLSKTYSIRSTTLAAQGSVYETKMMSMLKIKDSLVADGWTVVSSSNARQKTTAPFTNRGTAGAGDNWSSRADFTGDVGDDRAAQPIAGRFPWIVLQNTALNTGTFQVLINDGFQVANSLGSISISPAVGFTGGGVGTAPTASDSIPLISAAAIGSGADVQHQIYTWVSTDKKVTTVMVYRGTTNMCTFWRFCEPKDPVTNWTGPFHAYAIGVAAGICITYTNLCGGGGRNARGLFGSTVMNLGWDGETDRSATQLCAEITDIGTVANDMTSNWPFFPIGISSVTYGCKGRHGALYDLYWKPTSKADADTAPNDANNRLWTCAGPLVLPWLGNATVMALT